MRLEPGRRTFGLALAAALIYFLATNSQVVWLYLVCALLLGLIPLSLVAPVVIVRRVHLEILSARGEGFWAPLPQDRGKIFAGDVLRLHLRVAPGRDARRVTLSEILLDDGRSIPVQSMLDGATATVTMPVDKRGRLGVTAIGLSVSWPAGLLTVRHWVPLNFSAIAYPRYLVPAGGSRSGGGFTGAEARRRGAGDEFIGLREYQHSDSMRRIHWPTTARTGKPMVVESAVETERPARYRLVLLQEAPVQAQELAVCIAASVAAGDEARGESFSLRIGSSSQELRRWHEAMGHLANAQAAQVVGPAREADVTTVMADRDGVIVEARSVSERLPPGADIGSAQRLLEKLR